MADHVSLLRVGYGIGAQRPARDSRRTPRSIVGLRASAMTTGGRRSATTCSCAIANRRDARSAPRRQGSTAKAPRPQLGPRSGPRVVRTATTRAGRPKGASATRRSIPKDLSSSGRSTRRMSRIGTAPCPCCAHRAGRSRSSGGSSPTVPTRAKRVASPPHRCRNPAQGRRSGRLSGPKAPMGGRMALRPDRPQPPLLARCREAGRLRRGVPIRRLHLRPAATHLVVTAGDSPRPHVRGTAGPATRATAGHTRRDGERS